MHIYDASVLDKDERTLCLKDGLTRLRRKNNSTIDRALKSLGSADFTHLFKDNRMTMTVPPQRSRQQHVVFPQ